MTFPTNTAFEFIRTSQIKTNAYFVLLRHADNIYSVGTLINIPKQESTQGGWSLFGETKFNTERKAVIAFNKLCKGISVKLAGNS